jgi:hypothetical protein
MTQWEYLVLINVKNTRFNINHTVQDFLNELGKAGWELVQLKDGLPNSTTFYFKRVKEAK